MANIIDRRNSYNKDKNLSNRQRFIDRVKGQVKEAVGQAINKKKLEDLTKNGKVKVRIRGTEEPSFDQDYQTGSSDRILPGNKHFESGDQIEKPKKGGGKGGKKASQDEDGGDDFSFSLTKQEFLSILFDDLELPDMVKKSLVDTTSWEMKRAGYTTQGSPANLDVMRTAKLALGRRIALKRPKASVIEKLETRLKVTREQIDKFLAAEKHFHDQVQKLQDSIKNEWPKWLLDSSGARVLASEEKAKLAGMSSVLLDLYEEEKDILAQIEKSKRKQRAIPYFDPLDVRYKRWEQHPLPIAHAAMFCLMDVSGSMGEREKDIAKRFFLLLYLFLEQQYDKVDLVFIRHTTQAQEVDEQTFFYDPKSGGTTVSSALQLTADIIKERYDVSKTNIYIAQASDGDNWDGDNEVCEKLLRERLLNVCQYIAYIQIEEEEEPYHDSLWAYRQPNENTLWHTYEKISKEFKQLQNRKVRDQREIFAVFADLFKKREKA